MGMYDRVYKSRKKVRDGAPGDCLFVDAIEAVHAAYKQGIEEMRDRAITAYGVSMRWNDRDKEREFLKFLNSDLLKDDLESKRRK